MTIIVACDINNAIGIDGVMPWHIREDMLFFKNTTIGNIVVMGRKTWEGLPIKPLKERDNYVLSSNKYLSLQGAKVINTIEQIKDLETQGKEVFITGGGQLYRQTIDMCDKILLTRILKAFDNVDTYFPEIDQNIWQMTNQSTKKIDLKSGIEFCFQTFERKR